MSNIHLPLKMRKKAFDNIILEEEKIIAFNIITKRSLQNENSLIKTGKQKDSSGLYSFEDIKNFGEFYKIQYNRAS